MCETTGYTDGPVDCAQDNDKAYRALADKRRRIVLDILREQQTSVTLTALAIEVTARETENTSPEQVKTLLYHKDLPLLADAGLIDYDSDEKLVSLSSSAQAIEKTP